MSVILRIPGVTPLLGASFLINLAFNIFYIGLPMYGVGVLAWSPLEVSLFFVTMSAVMVFFEGPGLRRVTAVCNTAALIAISGLVLGAGFLLLASHSTVVVFAGAALIGMGNGLMWPLLMSLMAMRAGDHQGAVQGLAGGGGALAGIIGLILGGILYARLEGMLFVVAAVPVFVVMLLALGEERRRK
jgi:MFS family permease